MEMLGAAPATLALGLSRDSKIRAVRFEQGIPLAAQAPPFRQGENDQNLALTV